MKKFLINEFEGPLDLLLHLVKKSEMDIYDIKIVDITEQYISFIKEMEELNLDIASEYLVMASELILMKSKMLLPKPDIEEDIYEEDPEEELAKRLLEYKKYKESTELFKALEEKRNKYHTKAPENVGKITDIKLDNDGSIDVEDLVDALKNILERQDYSVPRVVRTTKKEMSIKERVFKIREVLKKKKKVKFEELFDDINKPYIIITFLSILEMAKNKELMIKQDENFSSIVVEAVGENK